MRSHEILVQSDTGRANWVAALERCFVACELRVALKGTAKAYPGSVHWHLKRGKQPGTVEVTLWAARRRLWVSVHGNRGRRGLRRCCLH